mmetsp:Transcript_41969/g.132307  ORF Transcript_41969/g.132307 Transcript_41969/m.132307 type:complete len:291 (+) Transcript_41969:575-1447(+)
MTARPRAFTRSWRRHVDLLEVGEFHLLCRPLSCSSSLFQAVDEEVLELGRVHLQQDFAVDGSSGLTEPVNDRLSFGQSPLSLYIHSSVSPFEHARTKHVGNTSGVMNRNGRVSQTEIGSHVEGGDGVAEPAKVAVREISSQGQEVELMGNVEGNEDDLSESSDKHLMRRHRILCKVCLSRWRSVTSFLQTGPSHDHQALDMLDKIRMFPQAESDVRQRAQRDDRDFSACLLASLVDEILRVSVSKLHVLLLYHRASFSQPITAMHVDPIMGCFLEVDRLQRLRRSQEDRD